jgi:hypothetical protein
MSPILIVLLAVLVMGVIAYAFFAVSWRMVHDDGRLRLVDMLRRHGAELKIPPGDHAAYQAALAARRCVACADKARCDDWLDSGARKGAEAFCPNTAFIDRAARRS